MRNILITIISILLLTTSSAFANGQQKAEDDDYLYWYKTIDVNGTLVDYRFYKTEPQFNNDAFAFIEENTNYNAYGRSVRSDYKAFQFERITTASYIENIMRHNNFLYGVCYIQEVEGGKCITNVGVFKMINDKLYLKGWRYSR